MPQFSHRRHGFTLIEALVATTVLAMCGAAVLLGMSVSLQTTTASVEETLALGLAAQLMDEIAGARYHDSGGSPTGLPLGPTAAETAAAGRQLFDSIDDYHGYSSKPPVDIWGVPLGADDGASGPRHALLQLPSAHLARWRQSVSVSYVAIANPSVDLPSGVTSDYRAVQVAIYYDDPETGERELARLRRVFANVPH
jgi:prepilin-type N-terminal cleavage/methylation domain-containing protein